MSGPFRIVQVHEEKSTPRKKTIPYLSVLERTRLIQVRADQLDHNAQSTLKMKQINQLKERFPYLNSVDIATEELKEKVIPLKVVRVFPNGSEEVWKIDEFID